MFKLLPLILDATDAILMIFPDLRGSICVEENKEKSLKITFFKLDRKNIALCYLSEQSDREIKIQVEKKREASMCSRLILERTS